MKILIERTGHRSRGILQSQGDNVERLEIETSGIAVEADPSTCGRDFDSSLDRVNPNYGSELVAAQSVIAKFLDASSSRFRFDAAIENPLADPDGADALAELEGLEDDIG